MTRRRTSGVKLDVKKTIEKKHKKRIDKSKVTTFLILVSICFLILFLNSYFNYMGGSMYNMDGDTLGTRFFYSGPDPYYNMRLCQVTLETGSYPFLSEGDPLLNYPVGHASSGRPPLFNMIAVSLAHVGGLFMPTLEALGWLMLFLPAIYGALLVFPMYGIGKELFSKKVGILSAFFVAIIPIHIGSGHGSAFSLFDHDSFLLLLFTLTFYFIIKMLKEKDIKVKGIYSILTGITIGAIQLTWAAGQSILLIILAYMIVQLVFDIFRHKLDYNNPLRISFIFLISFAISLPYFYAKSVPFYYNFYIFLVSLLIVGIYIVLKKLNLPWLLSFPSLCITFGVGLTLLYLINQGVIVVTGAIYNISEFIFGEGVYGSKVSLTIGEAHVFNLSRTVMSFGPVLYWLAIAGFILYLTKTYKEKYQPQNLFIIVVFVIEFWLTTTAGRFLNDLIPCIVLFSAFLTYVIIGRINYRKMINNIKKLSGFAKIRKGIKLTQVGGVCFLLMMIIPNAFMTFDAAVPPELKADYFGSDYSGVYGTSVGQQLYWADALYWLSLQDTEIENASDRPAIITWWDYGFQISALGEHPTVADNYQSGIPCAGNFHTAKTEQEAVAVLIVRICEGVKERQWEKTGVSNLTESVKLLFKEFFGNVSVNLTNIIENPIEYAPSYDTIIKPEWGNTVLRVSKENAMYHDAIDILTTLTDREITEMYKSIRTITGYDILYYGVEQRDLEIFAVFPFLSDKSTHGYVTLEDDYFVTLYYDRNTRKEYTESELENLSTLQVSKMDLTTTTSRKSGFFETMYYYTYFGINEGNTIPDNRLPTYGLRHWTPVYVSPYVTISKYYEGASITGQVLVNYTGYLGSVVFLIDEFGIPHDYDIVDEYGQYELISPPGNVTIALYTGQYEIETRRFDIPISEEEANWEEESTRQMYFLLNATNVDIFIEGLNKTAILNITSTLYPDLKQSLNITNGNYRFSNLMSDSYKFDIVNETGYVLFSETQFLKPGDNSYNITVEHGEMDYGKT